MKRRSNEYGLSQHEVLNEKKGMLLLSLFQILYLFLNLFNLWNQQQIRKLYTSYSQRLLDPPYVIHEGRMDDTGNEIKSVLYRILSGIQKYISNSQSMYTTGINPLKISCDEVSMWLDITTIHQQIDNPTQNTHTRYLFSIGSISILILRIQRKILSYPSLIDSERDNMIISKTDKMSISNP